MKTLCKCIDYDTKKVIAKVTQEELVEILKLDRPFIYNKRHWNFFRDIREVLPYHPYVKRLEQYLILKDLKNEVEK